MKLSLALIAERLKTGLNLENSGNYSEDFCLERAAFYIGEQVLESNTLYISRTEDLKKEPELPGSSAVIYTGKQLHFEPVNTYQLLVNAAATKRKSKEVKSHDEIDPDAAETA